MLVGVGALEAQAHGDFVGLAVVALVDAAHHAVDVVGAIAVFHGPLLEGFSIAAHALADLLRGAHFGLLSRRKLVGCFVCVVDIITFEGNHKCLM